MNVLIIDNFDSFTFNLAQAVQKEKCVVEVRRNNAITLAELQRLAPDAIVISPGPGHPANPRDIGVCNEVILGCGEIPLLGICLGLQAVIHSLGGSVVRAPVPRHGKNSFIKHNGDELFEGIPNPFSATRYHSLVGEKASLPRELEPIAFAVDDGCLMAVKHRQRPMYGLQFHPEAVLTPDGQRIIRNFVALAGKEAKR